MKILIGYSQRSGSTLLQHLLNQHSQLRSFGDASSLPVFARLLFGLSVPDGSCVKPLDYFFLGTRIPFMKRFDKHVWIARDPRDSYLSSLESGFAYKGWIPGKRVEGIDVGLLGRWRRVYRHLFDNPQVWHLVRYEDLAQNPQQTLTSLLDYLELPQEPLLPYTKYQQIHGGDYKISQVDTIYSGSVGRFRNELNSAQLQVFESVLGEEISRLGYSLRAPSAHTKQRSGGGGSAPLSP